MSATTYLKFAVAVKDVLVALVEKAPDIIKALKEDGSGKVKQEHEDLAQDICALRKEQERTSEKINALVESQEKLNKTLELLIRLLTALDSLPSGTSRDLRESIRDVLGQGGLRQDSGARVHEENFYSSDQHYENSSENQAPSGITCAVCRSTYNAHDRRPLIFSSCGHTFCEECLRTENRKSVFRCPSCRQDRDQFWTLKPNFALLDLLEAEIRDDEDDEDDLKKGLRMDDDDLLSLALHMSAQEAENKEYRRQVAALLAREPAGAGDVPGAEGGWQEEAEGRPGKEEAYCHEELEGLDGKKLRLEKEEAEGERKTCFWLEEEEELQLAMAMSLSHQMSEEKAADYYDTD